MNENRPKPPKRRQFHISGTDGRMNFIYASFYQDFHFLFLSFIFVSYGPSKYRKKPPKTAQKTPILQLSNGWSYEHHLYLILTRMSTFYCEHSILYAIDKHKMAKPAKRWLPVHEICAAEMRKNGFSLRRT